MQDAVHILLSGTCFDWSVCDMLYSFDMAVWLCSLDRLPSFPSLRSFIAAGNEPGFTCWNLASLSNDAGLHLPCALVEKMEGTRETLPRDGLKPSHFYVDMSDDLDFFGSHWCWVVPKWENARAFSPSFLPCFAVRKGFTLWSKLFFPAGESQK